MAAAGVLLPLMKILNTTYSVSYNAQSSPNSSKAKFFQETQCKALEHKLHHSQNSCCGRLLDSRSHLQPSQPAVNAPSGAREAPRHSQRTPSQALQHVGSPRVLHKSSPGMRPEGFVRPTCTEHQYEKHQIQILPGSSNGFGWG